MTVSCTLARLGAPGMERNGLILGVTMVVMMVVMVKDGWCAEVRGIKGSLNYTVNEISGELDFFGLFSKLVCC